MKTQYLMTVALGTLLAVSQSQDRGSGETDETRWDAHRLRGGNQSGRKENRT